MTTSASGEEPKALTLPPMVLYGTTRPAFLLARTHIVANNKPEWWAYIGVFLGADVTGGAPSVDKRWVNYTMIKPLDGVNYDQVPTLPEGTARRLMNETQRQG